MRPLHAYRPSPAGCRLCPCPAGDHPRVDAEPQRSLYASGDDARPLSDLPSDRQRQLIADACIAIEHDTGQPPAGPDEVAAWLGQAASELAAVAEAYEAVQAALETGEVR
jgi:hypothetical protein